MSVTLPILHFNDVYRVRQKHKASGGTIGADQFAAKIQSIRETWGEPKDLSNLPAPNSADPTSSDQVQSSGSRDWSAHANARERKGLVLFSGDLFSPSVESSVTRGTHLIPVINAMNLDCACLGNHDWDFGYPHLQTLMSQCNFPWLFSNVVDRSACEDKQACWDEDLQSDDSQVDGTLRCWTTTVQGVKVGCIGIVEKEWIATVPSFPQNFVYRNMVKTALKLSEQLRDPKGEACELVIALTHSRLPNDIDFANAVGATANADPQTQGIDLVLGGHDHIYYIGNGASSFQGDDFPKGEPGTEKDKNAMVVKSGTDFRDLSELKLELSPKNDSAVRKRTIQSMSVKRYRASPEDPASPEVTKMLDELLAKISTSTSQAVAYTLTPWDVRSEKVRTDESAFGDFVADVLMYSYEEVLRERDNRGELTENRPAESREVDCCIICGGSLRGDQIYGPGKIALSDILEILPFEDAVVCKELKGQDIWDALENGLSMYPKQEGRFPQVAGLMVKWDSTKPPGKRLVSVELLDNPLETPSNREEDKASDAMDVDEPNGDGTNEQDEQGIGRLRRYSVTKIPGGYEVDVHRPALRVKAPLDMEKTYRVVTREYLAEGYDGFEALKRGHFVIDHENGQLMSAIVRKFLLGASYIWRMKQIRRLQENDSSMTETEAQTSAEVPPSSPDKSELGKEDAKAEREPRTLSQRTRMAITRARSLNLLKKAMKYDADGSGDDHAHTQETPSTPVKGRNRAGTAGDQDIWRMVVDQSPGGFRDALHVGGSEHHSKFDSVSQRFNAPSSVSGKWQHSDSSTAAIAASGASVSWGVESGLPAAKRVKYEDDERAAQAADLDSELFDPALAPQMMTQIKELLALVHRASEDENSLFVSADSDGAKGQDGAAGDAIAEDEEEYSRMGANIAMGSSSIDEGGDDGSLAFLSGSGVGGKQQQQTPLSKEIVRRATELKTTFSKLEKAAKELPGGQDMNLEDQRRLLEVLETYISKQQSLELKQHVSEEHASKHQGRAQAQAKGKDEASSGSRPIGNGSARGGGMKHGEVQSSFTMNDEEMKKLREDVASASTRSDARPNHNKGEGNSTGDAAGSKSASKSADADADAGEDHSNLAFISPLVDGRLVDVARLKKE